MTKNAKEALKTICSEIDRAVEKLNQNEYGDVLDEVEADIAGRQDGLKEDRQNSGDEAA